MTRSFRATTKLEPVPVASLEPASSAAPWAEPARDELMAQGVVAIRRLLDEHAVQQLRGDILAASTPKSSGHVGDRDLAAAYMRLDSARDAARSAPLLAAAVDVCGMGAELRTSKATVRVSGSPALDTHTDLRIWMESPFDGPERVLSANIICDPFDREAGCTHFVRRSHELRREPTKDERSRATNLPGFDWAELEAGDALLWLGETWHGRFRRVASGDRVVLTLMYGSKDLPLAKNSSYVDGRWRARSQLEGA